MSLIPTTIITGFLGSGKTTLLKRVLTEAHGQKIGLRTSAWTYSCPPNGLPTSTPSGILATPS